MSTLNSYIILGGTITSSEKRNGIFEFKDDEWGKGFSLKNIDSKNYSILNYFISIFRYFEIPNKTRIGELNQPRKHHSAIFNGREIMVVGGNDDKTVITEVWDKTFMFSRIIEPALPGSYGFYPILHMVPYNFPNNSP